MSETATEVEELRRGLLETLDRMSANLDELTADHQARQRAWDEVRIEQVRIASERDLAQMRFFNALTKLVTPKPRKWRGWFR